MLENEIEIRKATTQDATSIALLGRITFDDTFGQLFTYRSEFLDYLDRTFSVDKIHSSIEKKNNTFWIAFHNKLPVGYAKLKNHSPIDKKDIALQEQAQLQKIYVLRDYQSLKIGAKLLENVIHETTLNNTSYLWLVALSTNIKALKFYNNHNFKFYKKHHFSIGSNDFEFDLMIKKMTYENH